MRLTSEEQDMLEGRQGPAMQRAAQIVVTLGHIYGAARLLPIASAQVAGVSYRNLGEAGLKFIQDWAAEGARVSVPTTLNPAGMDLVAWREMGISEAFAAKQCQVIEAYERMGIAPTCTCTPYLVGNIPGQGDHLAWSESSAVCYANSVLGARTNREGGPSALAAAICGRTADYGLHLDERRRATHLVRVSCPVCQPWEYAALGYLTGKLVGDGVPYFVGLEPQEETDSRDALKQLGAALGSSGAVGLFHVAGVTPEALAHDDLCPQGLPELIVDSLEPALVALNQPVEEVDLVVIGCPHASLAEIEEVASSVRNRRLAAMLWVTTARAIRDEAAARGWIEDIERAGGKVICDSCVVVAPMHDLPYHTLATNSAKMAAYAPSHSGLRVRFGSLEECIEAAVGQ